jgi:hypothetical protein
MNDKEDRSQEHGAEGEEQRPPDGTRPDGARYNIHIEHASDLAIGDGAQVIHSGPPGAASPGRVEPDEAPSGRRRPEQPGTGDHIFISYSRADQVYARQLEGDLRERGFEVWIDDRIEFGERWWGTIDQAVRACAVFVVVMTPDSGESEWVEREIMLAQRHEKPIFPLLLRGEELSLLIDTQYVDVLDGHMPPQDFYDRLSKHVS